MTQYRCWVASDKGLRRASNEDACATSTSGSDYRLIEWEGSIADGGWVMLADGIGGHKAGEVASYLAISCLAQLADHFFSEVGVTMAIHATHHALLDTMSEDKSLAGMGTTIAGAILRNDHALVFNVGDSRIYRRHSALEQISVDHVIDGHILTQCLGSFRSETDPSPHFACFKMDIGDKILLCSDGLSDMIDDAEIDRVLCNDSSADDPARRLVSAAIAAGGLDNISVAVVQLISEVD